eukprot:scaffold127368_cov33-Phaeocystis_antarctica.AAC.2
MSPSSAHARPWAAALSRPGGATQASSAALAACIAPSSSRHWLTLAVSHPTFHPSSSRASAAIPSA